MKTLAFVVLLSTVFLYSAAESALAQQLRDGCSAANTCVDGRICRYITDPFTGSSYIGKSSQQCSDGCVSVGQCVNGKKCDYLIDPVGFPTDVIGKTTENCGGGVGSSTLGGVSVPRGVISFNVAAGGINSGIGIIAFISNLLIIFTIIAGLWVLVNILRAANMFITGMGDPGTYQKVQELATMSGIGVAIIAGAYILAGLIGLVLFGDATYILNPKLDGALG